MPTLAMSHRLPLVHGVEQSYQRSSSVALPPTPAETPISLTHQDATFEKSAFMTSVEHDDLESGSHYSLDLSELEEISKEEAEYMLMLADWERLQEEHRLSRHAMFWIGVAAVTVCAYFVLIGWLVIKGIDSASELDYE